MPSEYIIENLDLKQLDDGKWFDTEMNLIAYDVAFDGYDSMLVIRKESLFKILERKNLELVWVMYIQKDAGKNFFSKRKIVKLNGEKLDIEIIDEEQWESRF